MMGDKLKESGLRLHVLAEPAIMPADFVESASVQSPGWLMLIDGELSSPSIGDSQPHMLHAWYIYISVMFRANVGKDTIHGVYGCIWEHEPK